ncbi:bifunctional metallophosphatase/5'-nucleotidase [Streptococcus porcinus]|uniref:Phosphoesterase n=2 Tax=Streptococcus porcinus TaxID=1340 RepID=A0A4V6LXZ2_STRPO|nr:metallophosphatase [Streptococcus porcinus]EGJ27013.1 Ser/Thr phosphatase family protein [Streptococcus porcinus str. Jelinkova 176]SQG43202.1 phosphoesterase [Streptococcus porcinus]VTT42269.1 phosphoesterase [Streptococcus porcinus]
MVESIRILHLNDLHSHFEAYPKIERFFAEASKTSAEVIKVDIGDNIDLSHPLTEATQGKANVQLMNQLGIQYATIGNNEGIGLSKDALNQVYDDANFTVILGNMTDEYGRPKWSKPYHIHQTKAGSKIALLAYTFPYYKTYQPNGWQIENPIESLKRDLELPEVASADIRILLSHLGIRIDEAITKEVTGLDLIIGAHTHHVFEDGVCLNGTYMAAAGKYGQYVGEINLSIDNRKISAIEMIAHETSHFASQKKDQDFIKGLIKEGKRLLEQRKICKISHRLNFEDSLTLIMSAMKDYAKAETCIINSGLLLKTFDSFLTAEQLHAALPHQMRLVRLQLNGETFQRICHDIYSKEALLKNQEIRGMGFRGKCFGQLYSDGFTYKNEKIVYNGKVMDKSDNISLVLVDQYYFASYFPSVKESEAELLFPDLLREVVEKYLIKRSERYTKGAR